MIRGDRREDIFRENGDRERLLAGWAEIVKNTGGGFMRCIDG